MFTHVTIIKILLTLLTYTVTSPLRPTIQQSPTTQPPPHSPINNFKNTPTPNYRWHAIHHLSSDIKSPNKSTKYRSTYATSNPKAPHWLYILHHNHTGKLNHAKTTLCKMSKCKMSKYLLFETANSYNLEIRIFLLESIVFQLLFMRLLRFSENHMYEEKSSCLESWLSKGV